MMSKVKIALTVLSFAKLVFGEVHYQSRIINQRVVHYENDYIDFGVRYFGDEGIPYLILKDEITPYNDLDILLYARIYDHAPNYLVKAPLSLCKLLHDESVYEDHPLTKQFNVAQMFNFAGRSCPIDSVGNPNPQNPIPISYRSFLASPQPIVRLSPYIFPANFSLEQDIGCGYMNVEAKLLKCDDGTDANGETHERNCETLVKIVTLAFLMNDACSTDKSFIEMISDGLTDEPIVLTPDFPAPGQINEAWMQNNNVDPHGSQH
ncbi:hypothetical protein TSAR_002090 [Trichomalopsis sarcophagae]|uniref:Peptidase S1 domain-containing protein n=1 Tax=Trichomalopsis sarcophagae TaxID=543379 RepID=A0A232FLG8_9HYME|nr:hypothetical protein TSAR_002090 [Trichomalopsis sarcophagae]